MNGWTGTLAHSTQNATFSTKDTRISGGIPEEYEKLYEILLYSGGK